MANSTIEQVSATGSSLPIPNSPPLEDEFFDAQEQHEITAHTEEIPGAMDPGSKKTSKSKEPKRPKSKAKYRDIAYTILLHFTSLQRIASTSDRSSRVVAETMFCGWPDEEELQRVLDLVRLLEVNIRKILGLPVSSEAEGAIGDLLASWGESKYNHDDDDDEDDEDDAVICPRKLLLDQLERLVHCGSLSDDAFQEIGAQVDKTTQNKFVIKTTRGDCDAGCGCQICSEQDGPDPDPEMLIERARNRFIHPLVSPVVAKRD